MKKLPKPKFLRPGPLVRSTLLALVTYIALFALLYTGITPEQYDIHVGVPAPTDIKATKDVMDVVTTDALREDAANAVEPSYKSADPTVLNEVLSDLSESFNNLRTLRTQLTASDARGLTDSQLANVCNDLDMSINREQLVTLIETSDTIFETIIIDANAKVRETLNATLPEGQENNALISIRSNLAQNYSSQLSGIIIEAVRTNLRPNMLIDTEVTDTRREEARDAIQPKWYVKDQVIVSEGEIVTAAQYAMIANLGILDEDSFDIRMFCGQALLVLMMMVALGVYLYEFHRDMLYSLKHITLLCLILLLTVGLCLGFHMLNSFMMPVSIGLLLTALLIHPRLALFVNLILSLLASFLVPGGSAFTFVLMSTLCGPLIVKLYTRKTQRMTTLLAGVIVGAVNFLTTLSVGLVNSAQLYDVMVNAGVAACSGIISAILCIGLQPLLEWMFNLATASKLIELSNPNQPLLRRLLLEASGTYHHSIIVANLAEAGCSAIGANGLLARVGAYYHDIGKLKRPMYFKENQMGDNPHDRTDPRVSTAILTAHTRDGAQMAQKARVPEPVVEIIRQHHGDTPVMYFYDKATKLYGDQVDISAFRYEGPRPQSREAAVVMLADTVEAAARALPNPDPEKIVTLIHKLVRGKLNDGQLDNTTLTFSDIDKICSAFSTVLTGVFHERIEYPDITIPPRTDKPEAAPEAPAQPAAEASPAASEPEPEASAAAKSETESSSDECQTAPVQEEPAQEETEDGN